MKYFLLLTTLMFSAPAAFAAGDGCSHWQTSAGEFCVTCGSATFCTGPKAKAALGAFLQTHEKNPPPGPAPERFTVAEKIKICKDNAATLHWNSWSWSSVDGCKER